MSPHPQEKMNLHLWGQKDNIVSKNDIIYLLLSITKMYKEIVKMLSKEFSNLLLSLWRPLYGQEWSINNHSENLGSRRIGPEPTNRLPKGEAMQHQLVSLQSTDWTSQLLTICIYHKLYHPNYGLVKLICKQAT